MMVLQERIVVQRGQRMIGQLQERIRKPGMIQIMTQSAQHEGQLFQLIKTIAVAFQDAVQTLQEHERMLEIVIRHGAIQFPNGQQKCVRRFGVEKVHAANVGQHAVAEIDHGVRLVRVWVPLEAARGKIIRSKNNKKNSRLFQCIVDFFRL